MKGGAIYAREGKPLSPARAQMLSPSEQASVARVLGLSPLHAMMYKKLSL
jgi:hypothetical protein